MKVLIGHDPAVSAYIAEATGDPLHAPFRTIGIYSGQQMIGGWALDEYTGYGVNLSGAGRGTMLREARQVLCDVVYGFLGCRRMGIVVRKTNKRMQRMAIRLGFTFEGKLRRYYGTEDGIVYSLLSDEAVALGHWQPLKKAA